MNGANIIVNVLREANIPLLFTLSGGHVAPVYVEAEKSGIRVIDVRHEASAVFAADAMARVSGIPGVAVVTAGPGVTNTITALKNAQLAQSPVLLIGGGVATLLKGRGALQDIDHMKLVKPHVKYARRITRLRDVRRIVIEALNSATSGVPGPVFIECPMDILYDESLVRDLYSGAKSKSGNWMARIRNWYIDRHVKRLFGGQRNDSGSQLVLNHHPTVDVTHSIKKIRRMLGDSERPVLLIGSGAMKYPLLAATFAECIEAIKIPVFLSGMARGLLGTDSAYQYMHKRTLALKEADCIILCGVSSDFRLNYGGHFNKAARKISISLDRDDLTKNIKPDVAIHAEPASAFIHLIRAGLHPQPAWQSWSIILKEREDKRNRDIEKMASNQTADINPLALLRRLNELLPDNSVIIVDGGDFAAIAAYTLRPRAPLHWLDPGAFGTLGIGGGFALGAALSYPDHYIWIIYGDGSAGYSLMEFDTFTKFGLKVCGIIGNNGSWEQIARDQVEILGSDTASTLPRSDYHQIAQSFGAGGLKIEQLSELDDAILHAKKSMNRKKPYLINAMIGTTEFRKGSISM